MRTTMVMVVMAAGCSNLFPSLFPPKEDVTLSDFVTASWRGRPLIEMQSHPVFSMLKEEKQDLPDGSSIYHHVRCTDWKDSQRSSSGLMPGYNGGIGMQQGTQSSTAGQACCDRQFLARTGVIQEYRQVPMGGTCDMEKRFAATGAATPTATAAGPAK
jgi:hypothetical protein